tara:strand:+ start:113 stop:397 length:285 start_codon:yes stop_codon:yes gene_type:complete
LQATHEVLSGSVWKNPDGHNVHDTAPALAEKNPAAHDVQDELSSSLENLPAGHMVQLPDAREDPLGQKHDFAPFSKSVICPAGHDLQFVVPSSF